MEAAIAASYAVLDAPWLQAATGTHRLARAPGRALRQAGHRLPRERRRPAYFSTEAIVEFFGRAVAFARFQLAWWINRATFSIFA
jgi:hypothetical protein